MASLKNKSIGGIILIGLGAIAFLTNPQKPSYQKYAGATLKEQLKEKVCTQVAEELGAWLERQCYTIVDTSSPYLAEVVDRQTTRQNFLLFSIYQANISLPSPLPDYHIETLGILGNFYTYQAKEL